MTLLFAFLIGLFAALRSLTPLAAVAWTVMLALLTHRRDVLKIERFFNTFENRAARFFLIRRVISNLAEKFVSLRSLDLSL